MEIAYLNFNKFKITFLIKINLNYKKSTIQDLFWAKIIAIIKYHNNNKIHNLFKIFKNNFKQHKIINKTFHKIKKNKQIFKIFINFLIILCNSMIQI